ncbi:PREDICTED: cathepsin W-like [Camelina sativa]|uniref:Cathepsin W-like n=1 Tax=Camelina sativa TaxID=90675 RepID=A0ABM0WVZ7_CAMSA|nr:PREDICTED: cathepsin W-like [Camelina sativa]
MDSGNKGKGKGKKVPEAPPTRKVSTGGASTSEPDSWDWGMYPGVIDRVLDQVNQATCWAIPIVRAVQALLNIGVGLQQQIQLSVQHMVNNVVFCPDQGVANIKLSLNFMKNFGVCVESQCCHRGELQRRKCKHPKVHCYTVDSYIYSADIEDEDLVEIVRRQPVAAFMSFTDELLDYDIDRNWMFHRDRTEDGLFTPMHTVLIVGYGRHNG